MDRRYRVPASSLETDVPEAAIDDLPVSEKWKARFRTMRKAGPFVGGNYTNMSALTPAERRAITFNFLAFLFGILYYLAKGMPRKALVLVGIGWLFSAVVTVLESAFAFTAPSALYWIPTAAVCAALANHDYYQKMVLGRHMWAPLALLESWLASVSFAILSLFVLVAVVGWTMPAGSGSPNYCTSHFSRYHRQAGGSPLIQWSARKTTIAKNRIPMNRATSCRGKR